MGGTTRRTAPTHNVAATVFVSGMIALASYTPTGTVNDARRSRPALNQSLSRGALSVRCKQWQRQAWPVASDGYVRNPLVPVVDTTESLVYECVHRKKLRICRYLLSDDKPCARAAPDVEYSRPCDGCTSRRLCR